MKLKDDNDSLYISIELFLAKGAEEMNRVASVAIESSLRVVIGAMTGDDALAGVERVNAAAREQVEVELAKIGLEVVSFSVHGIRTDTGPDRN